MFEKIGHEEIARMLRGAATSIRENHEMLSKLDSVGGDGDHGTTMLRAMANLEKALTTCAAPGLKALLHEVGWAILGVDGGATGPLLGTLFMAMSEAVAEEGLDAEALAAVFEAGFAGVKAQTKAQPGDKTMIDALTPAIGAMRRAAEDGMGIVEMLRQAAAAAELGAVATRDMQARFGRAKNIKEKSIGSQDPGATSMALIFQGFWKGLDSHA